MIVLVHYLGLVPCRGCGVHRRTAGDSPIPTQPRHPGHARCPGSRRTTHGARNGGGVMTSDRFENTMHDWLAERGAGGAPDRLHANAMTVIGKRRQRVGWWATLRIAVTEAPRLRGFRTGHAGQPVFASATVLIIIALLLAIAMAVVAAGLVRLQTSKPFGRNGLIAYELSDISSRPYTHVHVMNADGTGDREVAQGAGPSFARNGESLAYSTGYGLGPPNQRLFVVDGDGANSRDIASYEEGGFAFSPDGSQFVVNELDALWLVSAEDGSRELLVAAPDDPKIRRFDLAWSPDGKLIAYSVMEEVTNGDNMGIRRMAIDVVDVETKSARRLTSRSGTDGTAISWSPDSTRVAFLGLPDGSPEPSLGSGTGPPTSWWLPEDVFIVNGDGTGERNLTNTETFELRPEWSPDGVSLAFSTFVDPQDRIAVLDTSDRAAEIRIGPAADEFEWSPDGRQMLLARVIDVSPPGAEEQTLKSTISVIDARFETPQETLLEADYHVASLSWQWLAPD